MGEKKIFVKYHIAAPRKKDLCKLVRKIFTESSLSPLEIFRQSPLSIALIVLHTHLHQYKERIKDWLEQTCTQTNEGIEIVLHTLAPKQKKDLKLSYTHLHQNKEEIRYCHKHNCTKTKRSLETVFNIQRKDWDLRIIAHISHNRHNRRRCTFFKLVCFLAQTTQF